LLVMIGKDTIILLQTNPRSSLPIYAPVFHSPNQSIVFPCNYLSCDTMLLSFYFEEAVDMPCCLEPSSIHFLVNSLLSSHIHLIFLLVLKSAGLSYKISTVHDLCSCKRDDCG
jgi:hypothetical protein